MDGYDEVVSEQPNIPVNPMQDFIDQIPFDLILLARAGTIEYAAEMVVELHYPSVPEYSRIIPSNRDSWTAAVTGVESIMRDLDTCNFMNGNEIRVIAAGIMTDQYFEDHIRSCPIHKKYYLRELTWRKRNGLPTPYLLNL